MGSFSSYRFVHKSFLMTTAKERQKSLKLSQAELIGTVYRLVAYFCTPLCLVSLSLVSSVFFRFLQLFESWMVTQGLLQGDVKFAFVTCGDWDLETMSVTRHASVYNN